MHDLAHIFQCMCIKLARKNTIYNVSKKTSEAEQIMGCLLWHLNFKIYNNNTVYKIHTFCPEILILSFEAG